MYGFQSLKGARINKPVPLNATSYSVSHKDISMAKLPEIWRAQSDWGRLGLAPSSHVNKILRPTHLPAVQGIAHSLKIFYKIY